MVVNILKQIAYNNRYNPTIIKDLINKIRVKQIKRTIFPPIDNNSKRNVLLPFLNNNISQK